MDHPYFLARTPMFVCDFHLYHMRWADLHNIDSLHPEWKHHGQVCLKLEVFIGGLESYIFPLALILTVGKYTTKTLRRK
jgi:hypothetical protein